MINKYVYKMQTILIKDELVRHFSLKLFLFEIAEVTKAILNDIPPVHSIWTEFIGQNAHEHSLLERNCTFNKSSCARYYDCILQLLNWNGCVHEKTYFSNGKNDDFILVFPFAFLPRIIFTPWIFNKKNANGKVEKKRWF